DIAGRRMRWKTHQGRLDPKRLVFIDETWAKTNMTRRHGRCSRGTRLVAKVPQGRWRTLTFLAALRCDRITAPCVIDGPINGTSFRPYIEQFLMPTLSPGDVVVMGQSRQSQGQGGAPPDPQRRRQAVLPAALFARSQSDRTGLRQAQNPAAQNRPAYDRDPLARYRRSPRPLHPPGAAPLPRQFPIYFSLQGTR